MQHELFVGKSRVFVDEALDLAECAVVPARNASGVRIDEGHEFRVGDRAVDDAVLLGEATVEVFAAEEDLECSSASDQRGESAPGAAASHRGESDLHLAKDRLFAAGESN